MKNIFRTDKYKKESHKTSKIRNRKAAYKKAEALPHFMDKTSASHKWLPVTNH